MDILSQFNLGDFKLAPTILQQPDQFNHSEIQQQAKQQPTILQQQQFLDQFNLGDLKIYPQKQQQIPTEQIHPYFQQNPPPNKKTDWFKYRPPHVSKLVILNKDYGV